MYVISMIEVSDMRSISSLPLRRLLRPPFRLHMIAETVTEFQVGRNEWNLYATDQCSGIRGGLTGINPGIKRYLHSSTKRTSCTTM